MNDLPNKPFKVPSFSSVYKIINLENNPFLAVWDDKINTWHNNVKMREGDTVWGHVKSGEWTYTTGMHLHFLPRKENIKNNEDNRYMEVITGERRSGKTKELIKQSAETGIYILVENENQANIVSRFAKELGYKIPYPVTIEEIKRERPISDYIKESGVLVDESLRLLQCMLPVKIKAAVVDVSNEHRLNNVIDMDEESFNHYEQAERLKFYEELIDFNFEIIDKQRDLMKKLINHMKKEL